MDTSINIYNYYYTLLPSFDFGGWPGFRGGRGRLRSRVEIELSMRSASRLIATTARAQRPLYSTAQPSSARGNRDSRPIYFDFA